MSDPIKTYEDRSMAVPAGKVVLTGYVPIDKVRMACRDRMAVGDLAAAYQKILCMGDGQRWPPPVGFWESAGFVITDGRHEYIASLMIGRERLLVAWIADPKEP